MSDKKYPLALPQGSVLAGQYVIEQVLGQGGFGITYKALDHKSGLKVAIKEFFPDSMATRTQTSVMAFEGERGESFVYGKKCFLKEAETLAEFVGNKNIIQVYSYFEENGTAYFVMDFVEGISFEQYIREHGGRVSYEEAERILLPVMDALAVVHSRGIIHRDVTPDNIYITKDGEIKLLDFGAARYNLGDRSRSLDVVLKHGFAPKEQYTRRGKQGPFTDVYTLGASFYFAITGRRSPDSIDRLEEDDLIPPSSLGVVISPEKEDAILKAMGVQPSERFQTMEEFKRALLEAGNGALKGEKIDSTTAQQVPVQQRIFTALEMPVQTITQYQAPEQPMQIPNHETNRKKKWILPVGIGAVVCIAVIATVASVVRQLVNKTDNQDKVSVNYDLVEDDSHAHNADNTSNINIGDAGNDEIGNVDNGESEKSEIAESGPEEETAAANVAEILGNTPNNIANYGSCVWDGGDTFIAYPGGGLVAVYKNGDSEFLEDESVSCISVVKDQIYYLNNGIAYRMGRDGTNKELIPELTEYDNISTLYVSENYYYIYIDRKELRCIEKNTGKLAGLLDRTDYGGSSFTFLDGYVYYVEQKSGEDGSKLWRVPADALSSEAEFLFSISEFYTCYTIVSEGDYIYGAFEEGEVDVEDVVFFQYDVNLGEVVHTYTVPLGEGQEGFHIDLCNVCDQYVYFTVFDSCGVEGNKLYRFEAETGEGVKAELVYEAAGGEYLSCLSTLQESQEVVISATRARSVELITTNMDGSGEPYIIETVQEVN